MTKKDVRLIWVKLSAEGLQVCLIKKFKDIINYITASVSVPFYPLVRYSD